MPAIQGIYMTSKIKKVFFILLLSIVFVPFSYGQKTVKPKKNGKTQKTGVVVLGNGNAAIAAAFQSALSGVETTILLEAEEFKLEQGKGLASGLEYEFLKRMRKAKGVKDSAEVYVDQTSANAVLKTWADSTKKLQVIPRIPCVSLKGSGSGWVLELGNDTRIKAEVLVDAGPSDRVNATLGLTKTESVWSDLDYADLKYRTSVAGRLPEGAQAAAYLSLYKFLNPLRENFISLNGEQQHFSSGQAAGATAAYAVFYKTKTSLSNLKAIQAELVKYGQVIVPFDDVSLRDTNWKAIQFVGLSGFLRAEMTKGKFSFLPKKEVSTAEVREVIKSYYYKAQLWFEDYKGEDMTIAATLDLVSKVGNKSLENTRKDVEKKWKQRYGFTKTFEPQRVITRDEFAVIIYDYLNPFEVNVNREGMVMR